MDEHADISKSDSELIEIIQSAPDNRAGKVAKEILEYRKYLAQRRQNSAIFWLTIVLTISAIVQAAVATMGTLATVKRVDSGLHSGQCAPDRSALPWRQSASAGGSSQRPTTPSR